MTHIFSFVMYKLNWISSSSEVDSASEDDEANGSSTDSRLDLADKDLAQAHRGIMARTSQKYLTMDRYKNHNHCMQLISDESSTLADRPSRTDASPEASSSSP